MTLRFRYYGKDSSLKLVVFSDSSMRNHPDGGTQGGHLIMLMGEWKILAYILAVKEDQESCLEHFSWRDIGTQRSPQVTV